MDRPDKSQVLLGLLGLVAVAGATAITLVAKSAAKEKNEAERRRQAYANVA